MSGSIWGTLSTAAGALRSHQRASQIAAHNIANALTRGYSRQRPDLVALRGLAMPHGQVGTGVTVADVARLRDPLLDGVYRRSAAGASEQHARHELLSRIEAALAEPGDTGLGAALDAFWASWSELANDPSSTGARIALRENGRALAGQLNRLSGAMDAVRKDAEHRLETAVGTINGLTRRIADLNRQIVAAEAGGATAGDLRDARDRALDELAELAAIQVVAHRSAGVTVHVGGVAVVDGTASQTLRTQRDGGTWSVRTESGRPIAEVGGSVGGVLETLDADLPELRGRLDALARSIVASVNALHSQGTNPRGDTGGAFFHVPDGDIGLVTAATIAVAADVLADPLAIAAGTAGPDGEYRPGANDIALALAALRDAPDADFLGGESAAGHYIDLVSAIALAVAFARDTGAVHEVLAAQAEHRRLSVSGVSTDEELIQLVEHQTAYAAAAKVVTMVDEMLATLLKMV